MSRFGGKVAVRQRGRSRLQVARRRHSLLLKSNRKVTHPEAGIWSQRPLQSCCTWSSPSLWCRACRLQQESLRQC